ncbi:glycerophosphoryl diester phosphodiesterase [Nocardioides albertanoniae]|uniref:Glycerophosphoryl diester phosphodiesterase n=1 Tax=Nocardioides albertanoniae TaxID=1175486 RepID=A0A543AB14_9ACTN|nr:glycerophosphodiester phosphodiesterase family protein [Nocardioides albertanoniae]TQL69656.1 glycerophosphoryl diester phosphodiesterase [Nocardioides albertanoniae]
MSLSSVASKIFTSALAGVALAAGTMIAPAAVNAAEAHRSVDIAVTAHRGASAYAPENTLAAFALGIRQRADWIESDVQATKDGKLVLIHDTTLARTTDVEQRFPGRSPWNVRDFTLAEIKTLDAGSWFSKKYAGARVPTLKEMIVAVGLSPSGIRMELKSPALYPGIEKAVAATFDSLPGFVRTAVATGRIAVQSFDFGSMKTYKKIQPEVPVGLLGKPAYTALDDYTWADEINPTHSAVDASYVARVHRLGMHIHAWTVDDAAAMRRVLDRGVDGVITNHPDVLREVIAEGRASKRHSSFTAPRAGGLPEPV